MAVRRPARQVTRRAMKGRRLWLESLERRDLMTAFAEATDPAGSLSAEGEGSGGCAAFVRVQEVHLTDAARPALDVAFTADMEIEAKINDGSIVDAVQLWSYRRGQVALSADQFSYDTDLRTLTWSATRPMSAGFYELRLDGLQLFACAGSLLQGGVGGLQFQLPLLASEQTVAAAGAPLEVDSYSVPTLVDWNADQLPDLVVGEKTASGEGKVRVYLNQGTVESPLFTTYSYARQGSEDLSVPASGCLGVAPRVADWNEDGRKDLVAGRADGRIQVYLNVNTDADPVFGEPTYIMVGPSGSKSEISLGARATVDLVDWNDDGRLDLVAGALDGRVRVYLNEAATGAPDFVTEIVVQNGGADLIEATGRSSITVADMNGDGRQDLLVGDTAGELHLYANVGSRVEPAFAGFVSLEAGGQPVDLPGTPRSRPFAGDFNADGLPDLLVGAEDGLVHLYAATDWISPIDHPGELGLPGGEYVYSFRTSAANWNLPWHNVASPMDVDNDGAIAWTDVNRMLGELNSPVFHDPDGGFRATFPGDAESCFWDVNGDDLFTPRDTLLIINHLNAAPMEGEADAGPAPIPLAPRPGTAQRATTRSTASVDAAYAAAGDAQWLQVDWMIGQLQRSPSAAATPSSDAPDGTDEWIDRASLPDLLLD